MPYYQSIKCQKSFGGIIVSNLCNLFDAESCTEPLVSGPDGSDAVFEGCGPAEQLTIAGLGSATFGGTIKGFDFARGKEKTVTVNAEFTATGKVQTSTFSTHINNRDINEVFHPNGKIRLASGSLNIIGGITFSADVACWYNIQICRWYNTSDKELGKSVLPLKNLQREDDALGPSE